MSKSCCKKVPQIMQMEALECGAACVSMICAFYGKWLPLEQVRADCGVSRDGSKASNLVKALESYGFDVEAYNIAPKLAREADFPCIIHWGFNHFVVLRGFKGNKVKINDPARGEVTVSFHEFEEQFTGVVLIAAPNNEFCAGGKRPSVLSFLRKRLRGSADALVFVVICTALVSILGLVSPLISQVFIDKLIGGNNPQLVAPFFILLISFYLLQAICSLLSSLFLLRAEGKLAVSGCAGFLWHVLRLPIDFFSQRSTGDISSRLSLNRSVASTLASSLAPIVIQFITALICLYLMVTYSFGLAAFGLIATIAKIAIARLISNKRINFSRVMMRDSANLINTAYAGFKSIETLKATGAIGGFFQRWSGYAASKNNQDVSLTKLSVSWGLIPSLITKVLDALVVVLGVFLIMQGQFTIGMLSAFQGILAQFASPVESLIQAMQTIQEMRTSMERIEDVESYPCDSINSIAPEDDDLSSKLSGNVEIDNLSFGYSALEPPLIKDFSLSLKQGGSIALVGPSGCGKSTIAKLIAGLYQPWGGRITFDGVGLEEISREKRCASISIVDQDITLFAASVKDNLKMWDDTIPDFPAFLSARDVDMYDTIMQRPGGFEYELSNNGLDFSGGERQRLEIARALTAEPSIMIMDEATSALDAKTELEVMKAIKRNGISTILVTHRLSAIRECDEIIVLEHGKIIERGTHEQLFQRNGFYTRLVTQE